MTTSSSLSSSLSSSSHYVSREEGRMTLRSVQGMSTRELRGVIEDAMQLSSCINSTEMLEAARAASDAAVSELKERGAPFGGPAVTMRIW